MVMPEPLDNVIDLDEYRRLRWPHLWEAFERARDRARAEPTGEFDWQAAEALRAFRQAPGRGRRCQA